jgi:hypothetical protein
MHGLGKDKKVNVSGKNTILNQLKNNFSVTDSATKMTMDAVTDCGSTERMEVRSIINQCSGSLLFGKKNVPTGPIKKGDDTST